MEKQWDNALAENWKKQAPPARPSGAELAVFRRFIEQKKIRKGTPKILILGATPEFRDIIHEAGLTAYCVDYSRENYEAMKQLKKQRGEEVFFRQNWEEMQLPETFDLIFSEASLNAVPKESVPAILERVKKHLAPDGLFVSKTWLRMPKTNVLLKKMVEEYREKYQNESFKQMTILPFYSYIYDEDKNCLQLKKIFAEAKRYYEEGLFSAFEFQSFAGLGYGDTRHALYFPVKEEFEELAQEFSIVEIAYPEPVGMSRVPIYVLRVKQ